MPNTTMRIGIEVSDPTDTVEKIAELARCRARQIRNTDRLFKSDSDEAKAAALSEFADYLGQIEVRVPEPSTPPQSDAANQEDWQTGTRTLELDHNALQQWAAAFSYYIKMRDRTFRGETPEESNARIAYLRSLETEVIEALRSYGPLPGLRRNGDAV